MTEKRFPEETPEERLKWVEGQIAERTRLLEDLQARYEKLGLFGEEQANKIKQLEDRIKELKPVWVMSMKNQRRFEQILKLFAAIMRSRNTDAQ